jgi:hypothetical protein
MRPKLPAAKVTGCYPIPVTLRTSRRGCQHGGAEVPVDPDQVQNRCRSMSPRPGRAREAASPGSGYRRGLPRPAGRQQPQLQGASQHHGAHTVLTCLLNRSALYGVLAQIEVLGLDLLELCKLTPDRGSPGSSQYRSR